MDSRLTEEGKTEEGKKAQAGDPDLFGLLDHACRICGGRLLQRRLASGGREVRCAECGTVAELAPAAAHPYKALCFCGARLPTGVDAGLRCIRNPQRTHEQPQEVVVRYVPEEEAATRRAPTRRRPVRVGYADAPAS